MEINEGTERKKLGARETEADLFCDASVGNYRAETGRRGPSAIKASMQGNGEVTAQPGTPRDRDKFSAGRNLDKKGKQPLSDQGDNLLERGTRYSSKKSRTARTYKTTIVTRKRNGAVKGRVAQLLGDSSFSATEDLFHQYT